MSTIAHRLFSCFIAPVALVLVCSNLAKAEDVCRKVRVSGFPVPVKEGEDHVPPSKTATAKLGDRITVKVEVEPCRQPSTKPGNQSAGGVAPPPTETAEAQGASDDPQTASPDPESWIPGLKISDVRKLVPYLDARQLKGVYPDTVDPNSQTLTFHLARTEGSKEAWRDLLSKPGLDVRVMTFSVGLEDQEQYPTSAKLGLIVMQKKWLILAVAIFLIVLYIFFRLAAATALIRDGGISGAVMPGFSVLWRRPPPNTKLAPFSLARTQMAFWFFMVIAAFVLIWLIIGDTDTITQGVLVLIGISAGTALGSTAIDSSVDPNKPPPAATESNGFLDDILSDGNGVSFHRFQIAVWTLVLGFVFVKNVINELAMPDFGTNLLTLMGISSGTYLGMKLPEKAPESPAPDQPPDQPPVQPPGQPQDPAAQPGNHEP